jgi:ABC-type polysaccharide/polyol phosphate transport system ATPase subunit
VRVAETPAIVVDGVGKAFRVPEERTHTLKERALHPLRRSRHESFSALNDVSFSIQPGEFFGIVGRNGSGKSTLLKCLAGIYAVDRGRIWCRGRISTFIELGVGFNPDLAAYDNVVTNGIMLGLSPGEARSRYERIIEFAELQDFQDLKLKNYSSGMHVRLAFSVAIQVDAEILLIDEVLAVGDAAFQQKCFDVFNTMRDEGKTIVFVTHDMGAVNRFCHRAVLLERGEKVVLGEPGEVGERYLAMNFGPAAAGDASDTGDWEGSGDARIAEAWFEDGGGNQWGVYLQGYLVRFNARVVFERRVVDPSLRVQFENEAGQDVFIASTAVQHERSGTFEPGDEAVFSIEFENRFSPGRYFPIATLAHRGGGLDMIARSKREIVFLVQSATAQGGVVDLPYTASIERAAATSPGLSVA